MKILAVKFKNINSLLGEWEIRFDRPPLSDAGLFAIVGANGSGKSSILDAITLGLYGETPRLKNPEKGIVPRQADESCSEVTFSIADKVYRSQWSTRRSNGALEPPSMGLFLLNGDETTLEERVIPVRSRMAELTGLDFKRFCRSILLAQGDFATFLNAVESERLEILEKIVGPEMMEDLAQSIRSKVAAEGEKLGRLRESAAAYEASSRGRKEQTQRDLELTDEEMTEGERSLHELQELQEWLEAMERLEAEEHHAVATSADLEKRCKELNRQILSATKAQRAIPFRETLQRLETLEAEESATKKRCAELEEKIQRGKDEARACEDQMKQGLNQLQANRERAAEAVRKHHHERKSKLARDMADLEKAREALENRLSARSNDVHLKERREEIEAGLRQLQSVRQQLAERLQERPASLKAEQRATRDLAKQERTVQSFREKLKRLNARQTNRVERIAELLEGRKREDWKAAAGEHRKKLTVCRELGRLARRHKAYGSPEEVQEKLARAQSEIATLKESLAQEEAYFIEFAEAIDLRERVRKLHAERASLKPGQACPLCGSLQHPYREEGLPDFSQLDRTVEARRQNMDKLSKRLDEEITKAAELTQQSAEMERITGEWARACADAGFDWPEPDMGRVQHARKTHRTALKDIGKRLRSVRWQRWRAFWGERSLVRRESTLARHEERKEQLKERHHGEHRTLQALDGDIEKLRSAETSLLSEMEFLLRPFREHPPVSETEEAFLQQILQRIQSHDQLLSERETLEARKQALQNEMESAALKAQQTGDCLERDEHLQVMEAEIRAMEKEQEDLTRKLKAVSEQLTNDRQELQGLGEHLQSLRSAMMEAEQEALQEGAGAGFSSVEEMRHELSLADAEPKLREELQATEERLAAARSRGETVHRELESVRGEQKTSDSLESIRRRVDDWIKRIQTLRERRFELEQTMEHIHRAERDHDELLQAIAQQEKVWGEAVAEEEMLRSADSPQIRGRLERLMLDRLIQYANGYLSTLSSQRYQFHAQDENGLGLVVRDSLQGGVLRSVKSLSGGELFVVSLCMALGLSEMAGKNRKIQSLFLDEGFGTLDEETLYKVIATLKSLRANGKTVGVISHVKRLADEIPTQIRVEEHRKGVSRITIFA
ncbi:MAG: AAA family ATPase [Deltaproteobacteria bacterium]|nr:AAA family ATPase [Deltaproteobacteria bacterium]